MTTQTRKPTADYSVLDAAFDHFNQALFGGSLPACHVTLQRKGARNLGYYSPNRFHSRVSTEGRADEIALNPDNMTGRSDELILSTFVHEMAHLWQQHFGTPSRKGYHNQEWGAKMEEVGLVPSNTGAPGGRRTGQQMDHYIVEGGAFARACVDFLAAGHVIVWQSPQVIAAVTSTRPSKIKYSCPTCGQNAWAKPDASLMCGECEQHMEPAE